MRYNYKAENTCAQNISFDINGDVITNIEFDTGCRGNLAAIPLLIDGWTIDQIEAKLKGIKCGRRPTSCVDQLCTGIKNAYETKV